MTVTDRILITDLVARVIIGVDDDERRRLQDIRINISMEADTSKSGVSDIIEDTVNYSTVAKRIVHLAEESRFYLVEKLAQEIAALCLDDPRVLSVTVKIEKPNAIRVARSVGVEITRARQTVAVRNLAYIGMGSNIDPERHLRDAVGCLSRQFTIWAISPVYESPAVGSSNQAHYLNAAVLIETALSPRDLLNNLRVIETQVGRIRSQDKTMARTIDLDLVLYNRDMMTIDGHPIPDPTILTYPHLARTLADIAPGFIHPITGQPLAEIAARTPHTDLVLCQNIILR
jgi:2-amino-4-hydroxy-6-hydroxymethyldihydropteridine diphosphokinase